MERLLVLLFVLSCTLIHSSDSFIFFEPEGTRNNGFRSTARPEGVPADYPVRAVSQLIQSNPDFYRAVFPNERPSTTESRVFDPDVEDLCRTVTTIESPPKLSRVSDGQMMTIAQDFVHGIKQSVRVVKCQSTGPCNFNGFPATRPSFCRQQESERILFVYVNGTMKTDTFLLPSCCTCHLQVKD